MKAVTFSCLGMLKVMIVRNLTLLEAQFAICLEVIEINHWAGHQDYTNTHVYKKGIGKHQHLVGIRLGIKSTCGLQSYKSRRLVNRY